MSKVEREFVQITINEPIATAQLGASIKVNIPNEHSFSEIMLVYNAPALTGGASGTYIPNSIINSLKVVQDGRPTVLLLADVVVGKAPYAIQMLREINQMKNGIPDTAEYLILKFPGLQCKGKNSYLDILINTLANIQESGGDRTTLAAGTLNIWVMASDRIPRKEWRVLRDCGKIPLTDKTGRLSEFINPTEEGYTAKTLMLFIEDNGTPSNTAVAELELWKGTKQLKIGALAQLQEVQKGISKYAHTTGFIKLTINKPIKPFELKLFTIKTAGGTAVTVHWLLTSIKRIR